MSDEEEVDEPVSNNGLLFLIHACLSLANNVPMDMFEYFRNTSVCSRNFFQYYGQGHTGQRHNKINFIGKTT